MKKVEKKYIFLVLLVLLCLVFSCGEDKTNPSSGGYEQDSCVYINDSALCINSITALDTLLNEHALRIWGNINNGKEENNNRIECDLLCNQDLASSFNYNPKLLKVYYENITSDFRNDITILKYMAESSNIISDFLSENNTIGSSHFEDLCNESKGENFQIVKTGLENEIVRKNDSQKVGIIRQENSSSECLNSSTNYTITCDEEYCILQNNPILLPCTKYVISHNGYVEDVYTDRYGRKEEIRVEINELKKRDKREQYAIDGFREISKKMQIDGDIHNNGQAIKDNGGHIIPFSWGGYDEWTNLFAQNEDHNQGLNGKSNLWYNYEKQGLETLENGGSVKLYVAFEYPDNWSLRPYKIYRKQYNDNLLICDLWSENEIEFGEANEDYDEDSKSFFAKCIDWVKSLFT